MSETLVCSGRAVDDQLRPIGEPCGKKLGARSPEIARAAGWSVGPDGQAICPGCRRPAPEVVALVREVAR